MQSKASSVAAYLAEVDPARRADVTGLRALIKDSVPDVVECMRYGMPSYELAGALFCAFAAQKSYLALYVGDTKLLETFRAKLGPLSSGKGCIRFKELGDLPLPVVKKLLGESAKRRRAGVTREACDERG